MSMKPKAADIILFDGDCNLCNGFVQFIIKRDPEAKFKFASLQSHFGEKVMEAVGLPSGERGTVVLIQDGKPYVRSDAVLRISRGLSGGWPVVFIFKVVPRFIRDAVYSFVAHRRYRWFGQRESCMMPTADTSRRFISDE